MIGAQKLLSDKKLLVVSFVLCFTIQTFFQLFVNIDLQHDGVPYYIGKIVAQGNVPHKDFEFIWGPISAWFYSIPFFISSSDILLHQRIFFVVCEILIAALVYLFLIKQINKIKALSISSLIYLVNPTAILTVGESEPHSSNSFWPNRIATILVLIALLISQRSKSLNSKVVCVSVLIFVLPLVRFNYIVFSLILLVLISVKSCSFRKNELKHEVGGVKTILYMLLSISILTSICMKLDWFAPFLSDAVQPIINPSYENGVPEFTVNGITKSLLILTLMYLLIINLNQSIIKSLIRQRVLFLGILIVLALSFFLQLGFGFSISHYLLFIITRLPLSFILVPLVLAFIKLPKFIRSKDIVSLIFASSTLSLLPLSHNLNLDYIWLNSTIPILSVFANLNTLSIIQGERLSRIYKPAIITLIISSLFLPYQLIDSSKSSYNLGNLGYILATNSNSAKSIDFMGKIWNSEISNAQERGLPVQLSCRNGLIAGSLKRAPIMNIFSGNLENAQKARATNTIALFCEINLQELADIHKLLEPNFHFTKTVLDNYRETYFLRVIPKYPGVKFK